MRRRCLQLLCIVLAFALSGQVARADVAPPPGLDPLVTISVVALIVLGVFVVLVVVVAWLVIRGIKRKHAREDGV